MTFKALVSNTDYGFGLIAVLLVTNSQLLQSSTATTTLAMWQAVLRWN
jgi:formate/nitrite transporter FocA (FNT family)